MTQLKHCRNTNNNIKLRKNMNLPLTVLSKRKEEPITASQLAYPSGFLGAPRSNKSQGCRKGTSLCLWPCPLHHWILLLAWGLGSLVDDEDKNWTEPRGSHCLLWAEAPGNPQPLLLNLYGWQQSDQISQIQQPCFKIDPKDIPLKSLDMTFLYLRNWLLSCPS